MKIRVAQSKLEDPEKAIRRCGYGRLRKNKSGQVSYARRLRGASYPRFHVYIEKSRGDYVFSLHLDQRQACYEGITAHSGDYEGKVVEEEIARIQRVISVLP